MSKDYNNIPAGACTFAAELEFGDNGENATTAPVRMLARSSQPIEHWYWGNVVHDTNGFNLNGKKRLSIDADHDPSQAIGYANKFEVEPAGLYMGGTIISHFAQDRADKIMRDMKSGIPYEASINFGGDGIKIEEVREGESANVNGYEFSGPGVIIREWPLRNVAITLLGADGNTNSQVFSDSGTVAATVLTQNKEAVTNMEITDKAEANEADSAVELAQVEAVEEVDAAPEQATEMSQAVEEEVVEVAEAAVEAVEAEAEQVEVATFTAESFAKIVTDFGQDIAVQVATNGGNYDDAKELHQAAERAELVALRAEVAELKAQKPNASSASPVAFADGEKRKTKMSFVQAVAARANGEI